MRRAITIFVAVVFGVVAGMYFSPLISTDNIFQQIKKIDKVLNIAAKNYLEPVDTQKLTEAAIKGLLSELDVHSVYISAEEMKRVNEDFQGSFEGIGVEFDIINDTIVIVSPIPGGPSEALGIRSGDKIVKIDGESAIGLSRTDVPKKLKGPKGTVVEVDIKREGVKELLHFRIVRDKIPLNTVEAAFMVDGTDIGVIVVNRFAATTHNELVQALEKLTQMGMKKLVLDLRGNPGGYLNQAFLMAEEFIRAGDTIVYTKGRLPEFDEVYISSGASVYANLPLIVLINSGSASASEIVSGAIQDLDRGLIVGETSFGKGLVQRQYDLGDGSAFRLTIAKYYTPSGRCIQRPYKDKDKYRHLVGRLELEEGSYIYDAYNKIISQVKRMNDTIKNAKDRINIDSLPIYYTRSKRVVFGGGGITPDYIIKSDTITRMTATIRSQNLFFEFIDKSLKKEVERIRNQYKDFKDFKANYVISEQILNQFRKFVEEKKIEVKDSDWNTDKEYIGVYLKAQLARSVWTREQFLEILFTVDNQFKKALELFPEAIKIAKLK
ncbi:S41 family peptidase [Bacteroidetes/Chlorobi group bacterium MS-B_bin-24]|jgi:carboxyl-terminal processing protease|nr:MAG: S41 family peptidase [Bacteroidetes/Chlorobi group bacterium MS-B_bin-24]